MPDNTAQPDEPQYDFDKCVAGCPHASPPTGKPCNDCPVPVIPPFVPDNTAQERMSDTRRYLSFGGGVNSTALLLLLTDEGVDFEAVFVDHGTDYPETYKYVAMLQERGYPITVIKPDFRGFDNLYDYSLHANMVPTQFMRWCTANFKIGPLYAYFEHPCEVYIGIDAGEERRAKDSRDPGITNLFPLVERGIDRAGCVAIIASHGLPPAPRSSCFICPFQSRAQWIALNRERPDLWCKAVTLETASVASQKRDEPFYINARPLDEVVRAKDGRGQYVNAEQTDLWDDRRPCQCGL